jgi:hypothetical protein
MTKNFLSTTPPLAIHFAPVLEIAGEKGTERTRFDGEECFIERAEPDLLGLQVLPAVTHFCERDEFLAVIRQFGIVRRVHRYDPIRKGDPCGGVRIEFDFAQCGIFSRDRGDVQPKEPDRHGLVQSMQAVESRLIGDGCCSQIEPAFSVVAPLPDVSARSILNDERVIADNLQDRAYLPRHIKPRLPGPVARSRDSFPHRARNERKTIPIDGSGGSEAFCRGGGPGGGRSAHHRACAGDNAAEQDQMNKAQLRHRPPV